MKKVTVLFLLLALVCLAGCQAAQEAPPAVSLEEAVRQALKNPDVFIAYPLDDLYELTGISPEDYAEAVFLRDRDTLSGREAIMLRAKDTPTADSIKEALEQYLSQRKEETRNYLPEAYRLICDARVDASGLTVALIIQ